MKTISKNKYIILSSSCKVVEGKYRGVIIDYLRRNLYYISKEYCSFLTNINRMCIMDIEKQLEDASSLENFYIFLKFLSSKELIFFTSNIALFPKENCKLRETPNLINNCILTFDTDLFEEEVFLRICEELELTQCFDVQIRITGSRWIDYVEYVCKELACHGIRYIEIASQYSENEEKFLKDFITNIPLLSHIYIFGAKDNIIKEVSNDKDGEEKITYGEIYYTSCPYDPINCCGIINKHSLDFSSIHTYNKYKVVNGCLYKKVAIDGKGEVKNCPSQSRSFGNIKDSSLKKIITRHQFQEIWYLTKDSIEYCRDCELRYCCSDCRFIIEHPDNRYSKPLNCNYNIKSGTWS